MQIIASKPEGHLATVVIEGADMTGAPKQVAWATDIRAKLVAELAIFLTQTRTIDAVNAALANLATALSAKTDAKVWIEAFVADDNSDYNYTTAMRVLTLLSRA